MRKVIITFSVFLICTSCFIHKGKTVEGKCRPKNPNFKLLQTDFKESKNLFFNKVYTLDDQNKIGIGFYNDGRMVLIKNYNYNIQNYELITSDFLKSQNLNHPDYLGYWRVEGNKIKTEYFSCSNSGGYIRKKGEINGDTIVFERYCGTSNPFKKATCPEKYVLSDIIFE